MRIKKIRANTFGEALLLVKKELGEDALILSTDDQTGTQSYVEVTAAIDYDDVEPATGTQMSAETDERGTVIINEEEPLSAPAATAQADDLTQLKSEIRDLRESIEAMKNTGFEINLSSHMKKMFAFLKEKAIQEEFALKLVEKASAIEDLEILISNDIDNVVPHGQDMESAGAGEPVNEKKIIMLIGPTGVGKTTTVAKLAAKSIKEGKRVAMISIDTYKIGAAEQIRIYSRMIGIPLDIVSNLESLKRSIERFSDRDIVLIDTTGKNPGDREYIEELNQIYNTGLPIETQLLLSTSSDSDYLMETYRHYQSLPIDKLAFTKTDEAVRLGSIYNLCRLYKKPVAYITNGQRVPGSIEFVDSKELTNLILTTGSA